MTLPITALRDYTTFLPGGELALDLTGTVIGGVRVVQEHVVREWVLEPGSLPWARDRGLGLLRWINLSQTPLELEHRRSSLVEHARSVDYVADGAVFRKVRARRLLIESGLTLVDGRTCPLAVQIDEAANVIARFT